jgi:hypothetical protein
MEVTKSTNFFGVDISSVNFIYTAEAYGRTFYIHPAVIEKNGGKFEFPIYNCEVIEVTGKKIVVIPGNGIMRTFQIDGDGEIEDAYGSTIMSYYEFDEKEWREQRKAVIIVSEGRNPTIEWKDGNGNRWISTMDIQTGTIETIPNPNPPPEVEDDE